MVAQAAIGVLLGVAVLVVLVSALGVLAMREPLQRLNYLSPAAALSGFLVAVAIAISERRVQPALKAGLVWLLLSVMNAVSTQAIARAIWVRSRKRWPPREEDRVPVIGPHEPRGGARDGGREP